MLEKVCVIGAGVMGASIAALIAAASKQVILLDIVDANQADKNAKGRLALKKMLTQKPSPLTHPSKLEFITLGNLEDDLPLISDCDLVLEAIVEKIEAKQALYTKIIPYLSDNALLASNTSTLSLKQLRQNLPNNIAPRFFITHFFNPPRYMELVELVSDQQTNKRAIEAIASFINNELGKTIVECNDSPGFIANRLGCFMLELVVRKAIKENLNLALIDQIFTDLFKFPSTGVFGLYDLIGHDVMRLIFASLVKQLPATDQYNQLCVDTPLLDKMLDANLIGRKGAGGFYRIATGKGGQKIKEAINLKSGLYEPISISNERIFNSIEELFSSQSPYSGFFKQVWHQFYSYLFGCINSLTNEPRNIDLAMQLGYSWQYGPLELLESHIPDADKCFVAGGREQNDISASFLQHDYSKKLKQSHINNLLIEKSQIILANNSAKLLDYQQRLIVVIATKMNCLNWEIFELLQQAVKFAKQEKQKLYIYSPSKHFSAGADLKLIKNYVDNKDFNGLEQFLLLGQRTMMMLKNSPVHVISCALGAALGGGCELLLHSSWVVAHRDLNAGLVELGVGLIPGWGGVKEMFRRAGGNKEKLIKNLNNILTQNKASSADYFAADYYEEQNYRAVMNKDNLLTEALALDLPAKIVDSSSKIITPQVKLTEELDTAAYSPLQNSVLAFFQEIIDYQEIEEQELLELERQKFLELAHAFQLNS